jgi:hypothetical protein
VALAIGLVSSGWTDLHDQVASAFPFALSGSCEQGMNVSRRASCVVHFPGDSSDSEVFLVRGVGRQAQVRDLGSGYLSAWPPGARKTQRCWAKTAGLGWPCDLRLDPWPF